MASNHKLAPASIVDPSYTESFRTDMKQTAARIYSMAKTAGEVRDRYGYKVYVGWLKDEFGLSRSQAERFLRVHKKLIVAFNLKAGDLDRFQPSAIYLLASDSTPPPVRENFLKPPERIPAGKAVDGGTPKESLEHAVDKLFANLPRAVELNRAFIIIHDQRLYRKEFNTFEDFIRGKLSKYPDLGAMWVKVFEDWDLFLELAAGMERLLKDENESPGRDLGELAETFGAAQERCN